MVRGKEDKTTVVLYFDSWPKEERCVGLPLKQVPFFLINTFLLVLSNQTIDKDKKFNWKLPFLPEFFQKFIQIGGFARPLQTLTKTTSFGNNLTAC